ncbi:hypothetical protein CEXT_378451 [Caerostris extrusa]|uniref:Uncharacterized protein n=1 Tax=Caerostris extrusa TaxID=172846 RepID=A0AAV4PFF1_CAEEX|nr:hypothetical protein CEXT_378451 [Caerostris extrusa]
MNIQLRQFVKRNFASIQHSFLCKHSRMLSIIHHSRDAFDMRKAMRRLLSRRTTKCTKRSNYCLRRISDGRLFIKPVIIQRGAVMRDSLFRCKLMSFIGLNDGLPTLDAC